MNLLKKKGEGDPVTQAVPTVGLHGERVLLTPFQAQHTASDDVEGFAGQDQTPAEAPVGRLKVTVSNVGSVVIK